MTPRPPTYTPLPPIRGLRFNHAYTETPCHKYQQEPTILQLFHLQTETGIDVLCPAHASVSVCLDSALSSGITAPVLRGTLLICVL